MDLIVFFKSLVSANFSVLETHINSQLAILKIIPQSYYKPIAELVSAPSSTGPIFRIIISACGAAEIGFWWQKPNPGVICFCWLAITESAKSGN